MRNKKSCRVVEAFVAPIIAVLFAASSGFAEKPFWAKKAVGVPPTCSSDSVKECNSLRIPSPDRQHIIEVRYRKVAGDDDILHPCLRVITKSVASHEVCLAGLAWDEILWSPDSTSFLANESNAGEGPRFVVVYRVNELLAKNPSVIAAAQRDMIASFPPCKAKDADPGSCSHLAKHPEDVNVVAVDWTRDSSAIVMMAEMPCSSGYGGNMCQALGYEVEVATGRIVQRMPAKEFAARWRGSMAWKFEDPGPPEYSRK